ncbi:SnoaL-like domain-containing protein [Sphingomonas antarctica]|uniref:nuclear transport factor 2 family protein n=1 Tax=Sphingomonas antarctica TaxID=2040274 RepID=UPI0039ED56AC
MPTRERLNSFVDTVVTGQFVDALRDYYHEDAITRENNGPDRRGLSTLIAIEKRMLSAFDIRSHPPTRVLHDGDDVAIHWTFDIIDPAGTTRRMEEVALQRWRGDRIAEERFFFDPALPTVAAASPAIDGDFVTLGDAS